MSTALKVAVTPEELGIVRRILAGYGEIRIFGSRATGKHQPFSDLDVCLRGTKALADEVMGQLREELRESDLPYKVDLVDHYAISEDFRNLIAASSVRI